MSKQFERILICVLWLLAATLGTCFWMNTTFGFNIFSGSHWEYLAYLQAAQSPVRPEFYISLTCAILISLGVLCVLIRPRDILRRRDKIRQARATAISPETTPIENTPAPAATPAPTVQPAVPAMQRPRRIGISSGGTQMQQPTAAPTTAYPTTNPAPYARAPQAPATNINFEEMRDIFESNGYVVKRSPQIGNFKPALLAIGTNESLWMGGVGIEESVLATAMERLATIFSDTLDDIQINIFGFIITPNGPVSNTDILAFSDVAQLRTYIESNKNTPPTDAGDIENFNAYSEYIDTVINYMDKT